MGELLMNDHVMSSVRWTGMVALFRTVVGVSVVSGLLVVLLWSETQVGVKTPAHIHFQAHARGIPESGSSLSQARHSHHRLRARPEKLNVPGAAPYNVTFLEDKKVKVAAAAAEDATSVAVAAAAAAAAVTPTQHQAAAAAASHAPSPASVNGSRKLVFTIDQDDPGPATPKIYVITPTYRRPEQVAELTRLAQTLMLVSNLHWLVVEDAVAPTRRVLAFLDSCSVPHTYLLGTASRRYKGANKPRGVSNRNAGLKWLKGHVKEGIIYFADDDNTYDYRIFQENVQFYLKRNAPMMPYNVGFEEDGFLKALKIKPEDIEPLADNCTKILVWHTRTVKSLPALKMPDSDKVTKTNLNHLKSQMVFQLPYGLS
nr:galactosylgalactosylxylosylprotein 3-beta-glucuronosyltransferase P-like [Cherax quadricarinatus]